MINYLLRAYYVPDMGSGKLNAEHGDVSPPHSFLPELDPQPQRLLQ